MAASPSSTSSHHGFPATSLRPLTPTAREFAPADIEVSSDVIDATFVTHTIPDISPNSGIIGLCTVPAERAGMDDLGWHLADFLAWKALLCGETHPNAQTWMALCDVASIVNANPELYAHGKDHRIVSSAAVASSHTDEDGNIQQRADDIKVQSSAEKLRADFTIALSEKLKIAQAKGYPLVIIICGPTTVEQDIFFGKTELQNLLGSNVIRHVLGHDADAIVVTPALFSAGWQVNPSFCRKPARKLAADRTEFLARQFGGVFAKEHVTTFIGWKSPLLDYDQVDERERRSLFPNPVLPDDEQKQTFNALKVKLHKALAGRLSAGHGDHSFHFDAMTDDWESLIGPRMHKPLSHYGQKWAKLEGGSASVVGPDELGFLGSAFGGNRTSQLNHIKHLVKESFVAWPGYWRLLAGRNVKKTLKTFLADQTPDTRLCHEIFNVMEHRATSAVLADMTVACFDFPRPYEVRCRDWEESRWLHEMSDVDRKAATKVYAEITQYIPGVYVPPGVNPNHLSPIQTALQVPVSYLTVALCLRYLTSSPGLRMEAARRIHKFLEEIKARQAALLLGDSEVQEMFTAWLRSIHMPTRTVDDALAIVKSGGTSAEPAAISSKPVLDNIGVVSKAGEMAPRDVSSEQPAEAGSSTSQAAQTVPAELLDGLPEDAKKLLPKIDPEEAIQLISQMKENIVQELMNGQPETLEESRLKLVKVQEVLTMLQKEAEKRKEVKNVVDGSKECAKPESTPAKQRSSDADREKVIEQKTPEPIATQTPTTTPKPEGYVPPHLRHTVKKSVKSAESDEEDWKPETTPFRLSNSPKRQTPDRSTNEESSSFTPRSPYKEAEENRKPKNYIPPHLRGLTPSKATGSGA
ncbi:hypothetical protein M434DRAFT_13213 [Hypoxylon sp. CO27-5]|nr:hypothetical protein M434DRAFT_13213 [Hypoxylon sp. CO27-5]